MKHVALPLGLSTEQVERLKTHYGDVIAYLEEGKPLSLEVLENLKKDLSGVVEQSPQWREVLTELKSTGTHICVRLMHQDNFILNLPWSMAIDPVSGKPLGMIESLVLTKCVRNYFNDEAPATAKVPAPLKILVMVSSPEDPEGPRRESWKHRLSYEEEEFAILQAFEPLLRQGLVEIDFTENGSLEALKQKLKENRYHILHFSGHAVYVEDKKAGFLQLEEETSLETHLVKDEDFAGAININPAYRVPMVVLSSCQTSQGSTERGLRGVTNQLLRVGVPVVVSMGLSIIDDYASYFSARLYGKMANKESVLAAFRQAVLDLRQKEFDDLARRHVSPAVPLQWMIPNIYLSRPIDGIVDWDVKREKHHFSSDRFLFNREKLLLPHEQNYRFIGRRKEKARILKPFLSKIPILLKGQGGVGKTAMAEHLVQRLIVNNPRTAPFVYDETKKSLNTLLNDMKLFLFGHGHSDVSGPLSLCETALEKFLLLANKVAATHPPVFVFDNLETFQEKPGEGFKDEYADLKEVIEFLCRLGQFHVILTCRYPVPGIANLECIDLNQVRFNDFLKKCFYLDLKSIYANLSEETAKEDPLLIDNKPISFLQVVRVLHRTFGGNYRALEFFNLLVKEEPEKFRSSLASMESLLQDIGEKALSVTQQMGRNLLFSQLVELLEPRHLEVLRMLSFFRIPVQAFALHLQLWEHQKTAIQTKELPELFIYLHRLTLIEITMHPRLKLVYYYVTPIVKDLLGDYTGNSNADHSIPFHHLLAGHYYLHCGYNLDGDLTEGEEAFYHYDWAGDNEKLDEIGGRLSDFYYDLSLFQSAFYYGQRVYEKKGEGTSPGVLNRLGLIYRLHGAYGDAIELYKQALSSFQNMEDKSGEGATLNNISGIYRARGDYDQALLYLEKSLGIMQEIGDKSGEGATLNNMATTAYARGDYDQALLYFEKSLGIMQEIGDKLGEGKTLNNISQIYDARGDYDQALLYLEKSLGIKREIGDKSGEGVTLNNMSTIAYARGDYDQALLYLEKSLSIQQEIGDKSGEGATLNNISGIYRARGDYDQALLYLEKSLVIRQEIGDKSGAIVTLHNMAIIADQGEDFQKYLSYDTEAYNIATEINDANGLYHVGRDLGVTIAMNGKKEEGLAMLHLSLEIGKKAGFPDVNEIEEYIQEINNN